MCDNRPTGYVLKDDLRENLHYSNRRVHNNVQARSAHWLRPRSTKLSVQSHTPCPEKKSTLISTTTLTFLGRFL